ncbi:MAG: 30S ribosomal protein S8 [Candidatus Wildermuthbacteria bacterium GWA2_46_15]|uniref:Small ribosomal subunit protein uS8 n=1 Tax=Candidatus Wildermuthbacteria bacterium GWA2_46_15 TaxID=1802443 RepID=A0A1G2QPB8_9BACT|nr:MAG: 30S ribosomal protein S8 [Candidatus Wildermuthbacteria bacterium GWA2_46_15]
MDPIAEMLNQIKNAQMVSKETVSLPFSNFKYKLAQILEKNHFIEKVEKKGRGIKRTLEVGLKYEDKEPLISNFKKISRPGQRIFLPAKKIKSTRKGRGMVIISTSQGLMSALEARRNRLGGEVICEIW